MARTFERSRPHQGKHFEFWVKEIIIETGAKEGLSLLDIGCGTGRYAVPLSKTGATITGVDRSKDMLTVARGKDSEVQWEQGDATSLPFEDEIFDSALMVYVLHQIPDRIKAVSEAARVLVPGGRFTIMTTAVEDLDWNPVVKNFPGLLEIEKGRFPQIDSIKEWMDDAGLEDVTSRKTGPGEGSLPLDEYLQRSKERSISTLHLVPKEEFDQRWVIFEKRLRSQGPVVRWNHIGTFVSGRKRI